MMGDLVSFPGKNKVVPFPKNKARPPNGSLPLNRYKNHPIFVVPCKATEKNRYAIEMIMEGMEIPYVLLTDWHEKTCKDGIAVIFPEAPIDVATQISILVTEHKQKFDW